MPRFRVHDLTIESELPLLLQANDASDTSGDPVIVTAGSVPERLANPTIKRRYYEAAPGEVLMRTRGVGRMHIHEGRHIRYELASTGSTQDMAAHILGSGCAVIHQQRGRVALHGASICRDGRALLICGPSGAGKSTIAAHMLERDGTTLGDDVSVIGDAPQFLVHPGPPSTKLAERSLATLPLYSCLPREGTCPSGKAIIGTASRFGTAPVPLAGIVAIAKPGTSCEVDVRRLSAPQALAELRENTFRKRCITDDIAPSLFARWNELANAIPVWRIARPAERDSRAEIVDIVEQLLVETGVRDGAIAGSPRSGQGMEG